MNLDLICKDSGSSSLHFGLMDKANPDFLGSGVLSLLLRESRAGQGRPFVWGSILEPAQRGPVRRRGGETPLGLSGMEMPGVRLSVSFQD